MERQFHAASFIVSRATLFPDFLTESRRKPWFADFIKAVGETEWGEDPPEAFIPHLGRLLPQSPQRTYTAARYPIYQHSEIQAAPFYVPCNWKIKAVIIPIGVTIQFRLRLRFYAHGGASCALFGQICSPDSGIKLDELIGILRGMIDNSGRYTPVLLKWRIAANNFEGTAGKLMEQALSLLEKGLLKQPNKDARLTLEPDHLTVDLGRAMPLVTIDQSSSDLLRILSLTSDIHRRIFHKREPDLGLFDFDWVSASTRQLLYCNTEYPWPGKHRWQSFRRHGRLIWQLYRMAEIARTRLLWARYLAHTFEESSLEMTRAQNISKKFVLNLLKTTYYDDRLFTLAADLKTVGLDSTRDKILYAHLAELIGLDKELERLEAAANSYISQVESWSPGIIKFVDLFKAIGKA